MKVNQSKIESMDEKHAYCIVAHIMTGDSL